MNERDRELEELRVALDSWPREQVAAVFRERLAERDPKDPLGRTHLERIAEVMLEKASAGDPEAAKLLQTYRHVIWPALGLDDPKRRN